MDVAAAIEAVRAAGAPGILAVGCAYVAASVLFLPVWPLTVGAGLVWGPFGGLLVAWPSVTLGGTVTFALGRRVFRGRVDRWTAGRPLLAAIDEAVSQGGVRTLVLLRLSPLVPASVLHYAVAASRLHRRDFVVGTAAGTLPPVALQAYLGSVAGAHAALGGSGPPPGPAGQALYWGGLAATVLAVALLARGARRALRRSLGDRPPGG